MAQSAKIGLVGILALIVLVVAVWDKKNEEARGGSLAPDPAAGATAPGEATARAAPGAAEPSSDDGGTPIAGLDSVRGTFGPPQSVPDVATPERPAAAGAGTAPAAPETPAGAPRASGSEQVHLVVAGDTGWRIAERFLGNGSRWREIAAANHLNDPNVLRVGTRLVIPGVAAPAPAAPAAPAATTPSAACPNEDVHVVAAGETGWRIAQTHLGSGSRWHEIAEANHLRDPNVVRVGMRLSIPQR